ncbi:hypothetical protein [Clostridiisalibacter paucivorans]|uniref:hypothetical protein n=1 Tax=Clostridiisalibacter paucivorans TaxID=408753 RepID=UPI00047D446E|nr:hypothetical protein [Clostridiisalibacter paucivorans]
MKSKKMILGAFLVGIVLSFGVFNVYAQNPKETAIIEKDIAEADIEKDKVKEIASDAFKKYLNVEISAEDMDVQVIRYNDEQAYGVFHTDGQRNSAALITTDYEVMDLESNTGMPKSEDYQNYTYDEAKEVAINFVKESKLLGEDYTFLGDRDEMMKEINGQKEAGSYYFSFQYDGNKRSTIIVDKQNERIERFLLED